MPDDLDALRPYLNGLSALAEIEAEIERARRCNCWDATSAPYHLREAARRILASARLAQRAAEEQARTDAARGESGKPNDWIERLRALDVDPEHAIGSDGGGWLDRDAESALRLWPLLLDVVEAARGWASHRHTESIAHAGCCAMRMRKLDTTLTILCGRLMRAYQKQMEGEA